MNPTLPIIEPLLPAPEMTAVFGKLRHLPHLLFLDSAMRDPQLGRYSFVTADPFDFIEQSPCEDRDGLAELAQRLESMTTKPVEGLPPFQGGAAGLFGYDLGRSLENLPRPCHDEFATPPLAVGFYDVVIACDHLTQQVWIISQGFPERTLSQRYERAKARIEQFKTWLADAADMDANAKTNRPIHTKANPKPLPDIPRSSLAPQFPLGNIPGLTSNFSAEHYYETIRRAVEYIRAGDLFQVNIAQRLLFPARDDSVTLYHRLRTRNQATFAGYFDLGPFQIVSASPERFVQVHWDAASQKQQVEARPIKGTRPRFASTEADLAAGEELRRSEKDWAENVMIVDLLRNDLSQVCTPESVRVTELCRLELCETVQHLVSVVQGELAQGQTSLDLVRAAFPGGSITGAPKIRAMEIIAELEPTARGPYCGSLGYIGFDGTLDMSILIRTVIAGRGWWQMPVGGGITAQSVPEQEYEETWHKGLGMIRALNP